MVRKSRDDVRVIAHAALVHCLEGNEPSRLNDCLAALKTLGWDEASISEVERMVGRVLEREKAKAPLATQKRAS
jgi:hypothetical protein